MGVPLGGRDDVINITMYIQMKVLQQPSQNISIDNDRYNGNAIQERLIRRQTIKIKKIRRKKEVLDCGC